MRNTFLNFTFALFISVIFFSFKSVIFFSFKNEKSVKLSIKGRWYFIQDNMYKEIHATDSVFCLLDWNNDANRTLFLNYYINKDRLWSVYKISNPTEQLPPYCWGRIIKFSKQKITLKKDTSTTVFYKLDDVDSLFTKKISQNLHVNHRLDTVQFNRWLNYQGEYEKRMIEYLKKHPELRNSGNKENK